MLKKAIKKLLHVVLPHKTFLNLLVWKRGYYEPELKLIPFLCNKELISIDIGADDGQYLAHMYNKSKECYVFEPRLIAAENIRKQFVGISSTIHIENVALSNSSGYSQLKILKSDCARSTIEDKNLLELNGDVEIINVTTKKLDEYNFHVNVGFIKIDVEGHEEHVIEGGISLLKRDHPALLIEIEERHNPGAIQRIRDLLEKYGYYGFFYINDKLIPIEQFDTNVYQNCNNIEIKGKYIYNFIFVTNEFLLKIKHLLHSHHIQ